MSTYKKIKGTAVQSIDGEPDNPLKGQLWYDTVDAEFKYKEQVTGNAWSTGNSLNTARRNLSGAGTQTSALAIGGGGPPYEAVTESWNGSSWTEVSDLNQARRLASGCGADNTSALSIGGDSGTAIIGNTESWNGSVFSEVNDLSSVVTWADVPDANITESSVTQHQSAINSGVSITESQISDLQSYITAGSTTALTNKTFDANGTGNSISNIEVADLASGVLDTDLTTVAGTDTTLASAKAIKTYVDNIAAAGIHYHTAVRVESPSNLTASYDNGTSGVGATLTNTDTLAAISIDGVALSLNDRVLIYNQTNAAHNGVYYVSTVGDGATAWVLTRTTDTDSYGASDPNSLGEGDAFFVQEGDTGAGELYVMNTSGTITFGTTNITFTVIAETAVYSAGQSLTLSGTEFSVTAGSISSTQLTSAVTLEILDSAGSTVKTIIGAGS